MSRIKKMYKISHGFADKEIFIVLANSHDYSHYTTLEEARRDKAGDDLGVEEKEFYELFKAYTPEEVKPPARGLSLPRNNAHGLTVITQYHAITRTASQ
jgi:hypothetical protein